MQRWLKRITPDRATLEKHWFLKPFAAIVTHPGCWTFHRSNVTRAFALGLFISFIPPTPLLPVHMIVCAILGVSFGLNLPVLFTTVFVSNPFTWAPQVLASLWVGAKLMGFDLMPFMHHLRHQNFGADFHDLWAPLLLGALVLGTVTGAVGYVLAQCLWRARVVYHLHCKRARAALSPPVRRP